jgi:putative hydrolase of the HAD superfamily
MALRAVFLDVGNTLLREEPGRFAQYALAAAEEGLRVPEADMRALMIEAHHALPREIDGAWRYTDPWFEHYIRFIFRDRLGLDEQRLAPLATRLFARFSDPAMFRVHAGGFELLASLRRAGLVVGIVSNWSPRLPPLLERLGIAREVDFVLCSAIERLEKPDRAIFERALRLAGVADPRDALHAGDHAEKDIAGARAVGLQAALVDHAGDATAVPGAHLVRDLDGLAALVERLRAGQP